MMPESAAGFATSFKTLRRLSPSHWHTFFAFGLVVFGLVALCQNATTVAIAVVVMADLYLVSLLWSAANKSSSPSVEPLPGLPHRQPALLILPLVLAALVCAFAAMYFNTLPTAPSRRGALYFSFINLATFTYDQSSLTTAPTKAIAAVQLVSGLLLLICAFPLLVSRLATFTDSMDVGLKALTFNGCKILLRGRADASLDIDGDVLRWQSEGKTVTATASGAAGKKTVTVQCQTAPRTAKTVSIESDGTCLVSET